MSLPRQYLSGLDTEEKRRQRALIAKSRETYARTGKVFDRPRVSEDPTRRSKHVIKFEKKYGFPVTDRARIRAEFPDTDVETILSKGAAAYASGSRPNVSIYQWKMARLASVLTGGPSLRVDKDLVGPISLRRIMATA